MGRLFIVLAFGLLTNVYEQDFASLEEALISEFPEKSIKGGRWVYFSEKADIQKLNKPTFSKVIPDFELYKVTLTNYLGYHVNQGTNVILFDSKESKIILIEPLWFSDISEPLLKLFINKQFEDQNTLLKFTTELHNVMEIGSNYRFVKTEHSDSVINYDLVYLKGGSSTTSGAGANSTINYNKDDVWRHITIDVQNLKIKRYTSVNPKTKGKVIVE